MFKLLMSTHICFIHHRYKDYIHAIYDNKFIFQPSVLADHTRSVHTNLIHFDLISMYAIMRPSIHCNQHGQTKKVYRIKLSKYAHIAGLLSNNPMVVSRYRDPQLEVGENYWH